LVGKEKHSLEAKLAVAKVEKVLERRAKEVEDHRIVIALGTEPPNERNANTTSEGLVDFRFILELGVLSLDRFELDGDFLAGNDVDAEVDIALEDGMSIRYNDVATRWRPTERARANLFAKAILATNTEVNAISARDLWVGHLVGLGDKTAGKWESDACDSKENPKREWGTCGRLEARLIVKPRAAGWLTISRAL
jgi:hypothetical protein